MHQTIASSAPTPRRPMVMGATGPASTSPPTVIGSRPTMLPITIAGSTSVRPATLLFETQQAITPPTIASWPAIIMDRSSIILMKPPPTPRPPRAIAPSATLTRLIPGRTSRIRKPIRIKAWGFQVLPRLTLDAGASTIAALPADIELLGSFCDCGSRCDKRFGEPLCHYSLGSGARLRRNAGARRG